MIVYVWWRNEKKSAFFWGRFRYDPSGVSVLMDKSAT